MARIQPDINWSPLLFRIFGKSLLYSVDIAVETLRHPEGFLIHSEGSVRFGPKKSSVKSYSKYIVRSDSIELEDYELQAPGFSWYESFKSNDLEDGFIDPNLFLYLILDQEKAVRQDKPYPVYTGGKVRYLKLNQVGSRFELLDGKNKKADLRFSDGQVHVKLAKMGINFTLGKEAF